MRFSRPRAASTTTNRGDARSARQERRPRPRSSSGPANTCAEGSPMKRLILQMQMSVDGFVAAADPTLDWTLWDWGPDCPWDEALKQRFNETMSRVDTVLLSGPMADGYINHWTGMSRKRAGDPDYAFTHRIVAAQKRVVSQS